MKKKKKRNYNFRAKNKRQNIIELIILISILLIGILVYDNNENNLSILQEDITEYSYNVNTEISEYAENQVIHINNDYAGFSEEEKTITYALEGYSDINDLDQRGIAFLSVSFSELISEKETDRNALKNMKPPGFEQKQLPDGTWLYNRCHLIALELGGDNKKENIIFKKGLK